MSVSLPNPVVKIANNWGTDKEVKKHQKYEKKLPHAPFHNPQELFPNEENTYSRGMVNTLRLARIKHHVKDKYYTFSHAQGNKQFLVTLIEQQLDSQPKVALKPVTNLEAKTQSEFKAAFPSFKTKEHGHHIIAVDADLMSTADRASQLAFLKENKEMESIYDKEYEKKRLLAALHGKVDNPEEAADKLYQKIEKKASKSGTGVLWAIGVPRGEIHKEATNFCCASGIFDRILSFDTHTLQALQKGKAVDHPPRYKLINNALLTSKGSWTICCDKEKETEYSSKVSKWLSKI